MINMTEKEFEKFKGGGKAFPVCVTVTADQLPPIGIFYIIAGEKKFLLETVYSEREIGRHSFMGADPYMEIMSTGSEVTVADRSGERTLRGKVLDVVKEHMVTGYEEAGLSLPFTGGAVGYVGYDVIRQYERLPGLNADEIGVPEAHLMFYRTFVCYDHFEHRMKAVRNVFPGDCESYGEIVSQLESVCSRAKAGGAVHELRGADKDKVLQSNVSKERYCGMVDTAKEYIRAGDIFQVVLSQRLKFKTSSRPFDIYRRLRSKNPSPYLFFIDFGSFQAAGSSPEALVTVYGDTVRTNPIAGTRRRGKDSEEDIRLKAELLEDEKERAEHVMLVDLGRNDIGRIS